MTTVVNMLVNMPVMGNEMFHTNTSVSNTHEALAAICDRRFANLDQEHPGRDERPTQSPRRTTA